MIQSFLSCYNYESKGRRRHNRGRWSQPRCINSEQPNSILRKPLSSCLFLFGSPGCSRSMFSKNVLSAVAAIQASVCNFSECTQVRSYSSAYFKYYLFANLVIEVSCIVRGLLKHVTGGAAAVRVMLDRCGKKKEFLTTQLKPPFALTGFNFLLLYGTNFDLEVRLLFFFTDAFELGIRAKEKGQREEAFCSGTHRLSLSEQAVILPRGYFLPGLITTSRTTICHQPEVLLRLQTPIGKHNAVLS